MSKVDDAYIEQLRLELKCSLAAKSTAQIMEEQLEDAFKMATTKTDHGLVERDRDILTAFLGCVGYEFRGGRMCPKAHSGMLIYEENMLAPRDIPNKIFEFSDDIGNLSVIAYYEGDTMHFSAINNFVKAGAPWWATLPVLEAAFNVEDNTFWFMYRPHCLVGRLNKEKNFAASRITTLLEVYDNTEQLAIEDLIKLLDTTYEAGLTIEVLSNEIDPKEEKYGLPDLFEGLKKLNIF